jgi:hypothetical protein
VISINSLPLGFTVPAPEVIFSTCLSITEVDPDFGTGGLIGARADPSC